LELPDELKKYIYSSTSSYQKIIEEKKHKWGRTVAKSTISYHKKKSPFRSRFYNAAGTDHDVSRLTEWEKGYVIGFFAGDGSTCRSSKYIRIVKFYLNAQRERLLAQNLVDILQKANLRPRLILPSGKNVLIVEADSKALYEMICQYLYWENHQKTYTISLRSTQLPPKFIEGFVGGMADSDGGAEGSNMWYQFASVSKKLIEQLYQILVSLGLRAKIRTYISKRKNRVPIHFVRIPTKEAKRFSMKLNLITNCNLF
jgi:hypothetical protein